MLKEKSILQSTETWSELHFQSLRMGRMGNLNDQISIYANRCSKRRNPREFVLLIKSSECVPEKQFETYCNKQLPFVDRLHLCPRGKRSTRDV